MLRNGRKHQDFNNTLEERLFLLCLAQWEIFGHRKKYLSQSSLKTEEVLLRRCLNSMSKLSSPAQARLRCFPHRMSTTADMRWEGDSSTAKLRTAGKKTIYSLSGCPSTTKHEGTEKIEPNSLKLQGEHQRQWMYVAIWQCLEISGIPFSREGYSTPGKRT